jgi:pimeloyl-ACP methyl ester carboxylesterase
MARQALLYLPGLDGTGRLLHRQPDLSATYEVLCESYPQALATGYEELALTAARRLENASGGCPSVVLAESFGGALGLTLALRRPDLVERLVLVNTFAYFPGRWRIRLAAAFGPLLPAKPSHPATRPVRGIFFFSRDIPAAERDLWWQRTADVPMRAFGLRFRMIAGLDLRPRLREVSVPTLVLAAPDDRVVPPRAGRELSRLLPNARLIEPRVGHAALIHPRVNVARLLADPAYWRDASAATMAAASAGSRPG